MVLVVTMTVGMAATVVSTMAVAMAAMLMAAMTMAVAWRWHRRSWR